LSRCDLHAIIIEPGSERLKGKTRFSSKGKDRKKKEAPALIRWRRYPVEQSSCKWPEWKGEGKGKTWTEPGSIGRPQHRTYRKPFGGWRNRL